MPVSKKSQIPIWICQSNNQKCTKGKSSQLINSEVESLKSNPDKSSIKWKHWNFNNKSKIPILKPPTIQIRNVNLRSSQEEQGPNKTPILTRKATFVLEYPEPDLSRLPSYSEFETIERQEKSKSLEEFEKFIEDNFDKEIPKISEPNVESSWATSSKTKFINIQIKPKSKTTRVEQPHRTVLKKSLIEQYFKTGTNYKISKLWTSDKYLASSSSYLDSLSNLSCTQSEPVVFRSKLPENFNLEYQKPQTILPEKIYQDYVINIEMDPKITEPELQTRNEKPESLTSDLNKTRKYDNTDFNLTRSPPRVERSQQTNIVESPKVSQKFQTSSDLSNELTSSSGQISERPIPKPRTKINTQPIQKIPNRKNIDQAIMELLNLYPKCFELESTSNSQLSPLSIGDRIYAKLFGPTLDESILFAYDAFESIWNQCPSRRKSDPSLAKTEGKWIRSLPNLLFLTKWLKREYEKLEMDQGKYPREMLESRQCVLDCLMTLLGEKRRADKSKSDSKLNGSSGKVHRKRKKDPIKTNSVYKMPSPKLNIRPVEKDQNKGVVLRKNHLITLKNHNSDSNETDFMKPELNLNPCRCNPNFKNHRYEGSIFRSSEESLLNLKIWCYDSESVNEQSRGPPVDQPKFQSELVDIKKLIEEMCPDCTRLKKLLEPSQVISKNKPFCPCKNKHPCKCSNLEPKEVLINPYFKKPEIVQKEMQFKLEELNKPAQFKMEHSLSPLFLYPEDKRENFKKETQFGLEEISKTDESKLKNLEDSSVGFLLNPQDISTPRNESIPNWVGSPHDNREVFKPQMPFELEKINKTTQTKIKNSEDSSVGLFMTSKDQREVFKNEIEFGLEEINKTNERGLKKLEESSVGFILKPKDIITPRNESKPNWAVSNDLQNQDSLNKPEIEIIQNMDSNKILNVSNFSMESNGKIKVQLEIVANKTSEISTMTDHHQNSPIVQTQFPEQSPIRNRVSKRGSRKRKPKPIKTSTTQTERLLEPFFSFMDQPGIPTKDSCDSGIQVNPKCTCAVQTHGMRTCGGDEDHGRIGPSKYAVVRISDYRKFRTYEVMKNSKSLPQCNYIPKDIFVIKKGLK